MANRDPLDVFDGARRHLSYDEPGEQSVGGFDLEDDSTPESATTEAPAVVAEPVMRPLKQARWRFPRGIDKARLAANETRVRQFATHRPLNIVVANPKATGKTITSLVLGGQLAQLRDGGVAILEATPTSGDLALRGEGVPAVGVTELLAELAASVPGQVDVTPYLAEQSSGAAVLGSVSPRGELTPEEAEALRSLVNAGHELTVVDTGNNTLDPAFDESLMSADAVVIPVLPNLAALRGAQDVVQAIRALRGDDGLLERTVLVISHDGGPEAPEVTGAALENLARDLYPALAAVVEVPFDAAIRHDSVSLRMDALSVRSVHAWREVARQVVVALSTIPPA